MDNYDIAAETAPVTNAGGEPALTQASSSGDWMGSAMAQAGAIVGGYVSRRIDLDLQGRTLAMQGTATRRGSGGGIAPNSTGAQGQLGGLNMTALMPWLIGGAVLLLLLKR
jgi:hypothetical protein